MDDACARCHAPLTPEALFCAACGAPQLRVEASQAESEEFDNASGPQGALPDQIAWPSAVTSAAVVALPVGVLSSFLSFSTLWVLAGGVWTINLYRRRSGSPLSTTLGSRIGCVFGVFAALVMTVVDALHLLISRYGLHRGAEIDSRLHLAMQAGLDRVQASNPDAAQQIPWFFHFWLSPDGQAALVLASTILSAVSMLGFSALGGALGSRWYGQRRAWSR